MQKKETTKFISAKFEKTFIQVTWYCKFEDLRANRVGPDEAAHYESPHLAYTVCKYNYFHFWCIKCYGNIFLKASKDLCRISGQKNSENHILISKNMRIIQIAKI